MGTPIGVEIHLQLEIAAPFAPPLEKTNLYLRLYGVRHMVKDHSDSERGNPLPPHGLLFPINSKREREMFYLTTHSTHFIYGYMASVIWLRTILIVRKDPAAAT